MPSYSSLFQKVQPDGSVLFEFDGHVHADGLDITVGADRSATADRQIRWIEEDGTPHARLLGFYDTVTDPAFPREAVDLAAVSQDIRFSIESTVGGFSGVGASFLGFEQLLCDSLYRSSYVRNIENQNNRAVLVGSHSFVTLPSVQWSDTVNIGTFNDAVEAAIVIPQNGVNLFTWSAAGYTNTGFDIVGRWADGVARAANVSFQYVVLIPYS